MSAVPQTEHGPGWRRLRLAEACLPRTRRGLVGLGCTAVFALAHGTAAADAAPDAPMTVDQEDAERLRALGYVDFAPDPDEGTDQGVTHLDLEKSAPGHTLIVSSLGCSAQLVDLEGNELHAWSQKRCRQWWGAALSRNGDLFVNGSLADESAAKGKTGKKPKTKRFTARISWTGETKWVLIMRSHHQLDLTPTGELMVLTETTVGGKLLSVARKRAGLAADNSLKLHDNILKWLNPDDGAVLESLSLLEAIAAASHSDFPFADLEKLMEGTKDVGLFHCNTAFAMDQPHLANTHALFSEHNVLLSSRNQNLIFIVNRKTRSLVWAWGETELQAPHTATWLANGHILVFDNGIDREQSRVLEIDPKKRTILWQYPDEKGTPFFSKTRGASQRLENGNTLIVEANAGKAFEITPQGDLAWEYHTSITPKGKRHVIIVLRRYPESWIELPAS